MVKLVALFITNLLLLSHLHAQKPEHISFVHIGVNEGLSQNTIFLSWNIGIIGNFFRLKVDFE